METFEQQFKKRLLNDLSNGVYGNSTEWANGITKHYMSAIRLHAPTSIPPTLPSPALLGNPAPVGPGVALSTMQRKKIFQEIIRAYFVAKEIGQGKVQIRQVSEDVQRTIGLTQKLARDVNRTIQEIQTLTEKIQNIKQDLQNLKPELEKIVETKKEAFKQIGVEFQAMIQRFKDAGALNPTDAIDPEVVFAAEIALFNQIVSFKIKLPTSFGEIRELYTTIYAIERTISGTIRRYKNIFTKEANLKTFFVKKIKAIFDDIMNLVNVFIRPDRYISVLKQLLYSPTLKKIAKIILNLVNNSKELTAKKEELIKKNKQRIEAIGPYLKRKKEALIQKLQDLISQQTDRIKKDKKQRQALKIPQKLKEFAKKIATFVKKQARRIDYLVRLVGTASRIAVKIMGLIVSVQTDAQAFFDKVANSIKTKYTDIKASAQSTKFKELIEGARSRIDSIKLSDAVDRYKTGNTGVDEMIGALDANLPILATIINNLQQAFRLTPKQLAALIRKPMAQVQAYIISIEEILSKDIPQLRYLIREVDPTSPDYKAKVAKSKEIGAELPNVEQRKRERAYAGHMKLIELCKKGLAQLREFERELTDDIQAKKKENEKLVVDQANLQQYATDYLDTGADAEKKRKRDNRRRRRQEKAASYKENLQKLKRVAQEAQIAFNITTSAPKVGAILLTSPKPVSDIEGPLKKLVSSYYDLRVLQNKMTPKEKLDNLLRYNKKFKDFIAYEQIYLFTTEMIGMAKESKIGDELAKIIEEQKQRMDQKSEKALTALLGFLSKDPKTMTLADIIKLPVEGFYTADAITALVQAERRLARNLRTKLSAFGDSIPLDTDDYILKKVRLGLKKVSSWLVFLFDMVQKAIRAILKWIKEHIIDPVTDYIKTKLKERRERIQQEQAERIQVRVDKAINLDAKAMSLVFSTAARAFWTGTSWQNAVGTTFTTLNIGRFNELKGTMHGGADSFATELANSFGTQLRAMTGIYTPAAAYSIPPAPFSGYTPGGQPAIGVNPPSPPTV
jgi:hypothetical protein